MALMKSLWIPVLFCLVPGLHGAAAANTAVAEISEMGRDGCIRSVSAASSPRTAIVEVCVTESSSEILLSQRRRGGPARVFDRQPRTESGLSAYLVTTNSARQWLLLESQDSTPGSAWVLWDLSTGLKVLYGRSSNIPYVRDLDADGFAELVIFDDLLLTPTALWQDEAFGLPHVYRLGETMESRSLRDYPAVVREFIMQADIAIEAFSLPCASLTAAEQASDQNCRELAGFAAGAAKARDFAALFLSGRPPAR